MTTVIHTTSRPGGSRVRSAASVLSPAGNVRPNLFVYGTLRRGGRYHLEYFPEQPPVRPARTPGRLFDLPAGYPAVALIGAQVLAEASGDPDADRARELQGRVDLSRAGAALPPTGREWVYGELVTVPDYHRLQGVDRLEGFRPGRQSLFLRMLVPVWADDAGAPVPAWVYVQPDPQGIYLPQGRWKE